MKKTMLLVSLLALTLVVHSGTVLAQDEGADSLKADQTEATTPPAGEAEEAAEAVADSAKAGDETVVDSAKAGDETATDDPAKTEEAPATDDAAKDDEAPVTDDAAKDDDAPATDDAAKDDDAPATDDAAKGDEAPATDDAAESGDEEESVTEPAAVDPNAPYAAVTFEEGEKPKLLMETSMGDITIELWPDLAPKHCQSFVYLIEKGFYDSLTFHRIVPGFVIQGGDPVGNGTGGPGYSVPAEFSSRPHEDGILSMARSADPNSAGSQFFLCLGRLGSLDNKYTIFGRVTEGLDIIHQIEKVPTQSERPKTPVVMTKVSMIVDN